MLPQGTRLSKKKTHHSPLPPHADIDEPREHRRKFTRHGQTPAVYSEFLRSFMGEPLYGLSVSVVSDLIWNNGSPCKVALTISVIEISLSDSTGAPNKPSRIRFTVYDVFVVHMGAVARMTCDASVSVSHYPDRNKVPENGVAKL